MKIAFKLKEWHLHSTNQSKRKKSPVLGTDYPPMVKSVKSVWKQYNGENIVFLHFSQGSCIPVFW